MYSSLSLSLSLYLPYSKFLNENWVTQNPPKLCHLTQKIGSSALMTLLGGRVIIDDLDPQAILLEFRVHSAS
jgi:hypothetical protein